MSSVSAKFIAVSLEITGGGSFIVVPLEKVIVAVICTRPTAFYVFFYLYKTVASSIVFYS